MRKLVVAIGLIMMASSLANAQQEFMVTHYMFNGLAINPAYAGVHGGISASILHRNQWMGFEGAPSTQLASLHSPIKNTPVSLGGVVFRDAIGYSSEHGAFLSYAYRMKLNYELQLSFGLQGSIHQYNSDYAGVSNDVFDVGDQLVNVNEMNYNFGAGLLLHTDRVYAGLSMPQLVNPEIGINRGAQGFTQKVRHYYITGGYVFDVSRSVTLKPNFFVKIVENAPYQIDLNLNALISEFLWLGASYRSFESIDAILGFQITPQMQISYATDFTLTEVDAQSHEVMLNYIFSLPKRKIMSPRYF